MDSTGAVKASTPGQNAQGSSPEFRAAGSGAIFNASYANPVPTSMQDVLSNTRGFLSHRMMVEDLVWEYPIRNQGAFGATQFTAWFNMATIHLAASDAETKNPCLLGSGCCW